jgi:hypothetical protein
MASPDAILPEQIGKEVYDTFSRGLEWARYDWNLDVRLLSESELSEVVTHWGSASFNFGGRFEDDYIEKIRGIEDDYDNRFPDGIDHLLEKLAKKSEV